MATTRRNEVPPRASSSTALRTSASDRPFAARRPRGVRGVRAAGGAPAGPAPAPAATDGARRGVAGAVAGEAGGVPLKAPPDGVRARGAAARGTRRVQLVRGEGRGVST
jgi:hypothetical protein